MWRRLLSSNLKTLAATTAAAPTRSTSIHTRSLISPSASASLFNLRHFTADSADGAVKKRVEDVMPIATERELLEGLLQPGGNFWIESDLESEHEQLESEDQLTVVNYRCGPFGTKEEPAIIESYYDKRIAACFGGDGRDEHDIVCFWLEKGKPRECPVCPQYFELKVVGPGGPPPP